MCLCSVHWLKIKKKKKTFSLFVFYLSRNPIYNITCGIVFQLTQIFAGEFEAKAECY